MGSNDTYNLFINGNCKKTSGRGPLRAFLLMSLERKSPNTASGESGFNTILDSQVVNFQVEHAKGQDFLKCLEGVSAKTSLDPRYNAT